MKVSMGIGADYGIYLEKYHEKRYATVWPTLMKNRSLILSSLGKDIDISGSI
jgi:predicted RND superfamily exporter protein